MGTSFGRQCIPSGSPRPDNDVTDSLLASWSLVSKPVEETNSETLTTYGQAELKLPKSLRDLQLAEHSEDSLQRKCKIICTMGPSCWDVDMLVKLIDAGMNICRLNFSHGDHASHGATIERIRAAAKQRPKKPIAILLDTKGPEIRTGFFATGKTIDLTAGDELKVTTDYSFKGDSKCIAVTYKELPQSVKPGSTILCADGSLSLQVKSCGDDHVITTVMNNCTIGERKNVNLPGVKVKLPVLQEKDIDDLVNFGIPQGVDFVAASFVQSKEDVDFIRKTLGEKGKNIKIISKIENREGLYNFDEICEASDGIMVARGDLGMEVPPEKVFLAQKIMIGKCNIMGTPAITATQMLESMTKSPRPTRAEAGDVANAVLDGTDCVMLSGETAGGQFPVEAVTVMRKIVEEAERALDYGSLYLHTSLSVVDYAHQLSQTEATCSSAVETAFEIKSPALICLSEKGYGAAQMAKYRPEAPIFALTPHESVLRQLCCLRGVVPMLARPKSTIDEIMQQAIDFAMQEGVLKEADTIVTVSGTYNEIPFGAGRSNVMKIIDLPKAFQRGVTGEDFEAPPADSNEGQTYGQAKLSLPSQMTGLDMMEHTEDSSKRKCKIICTMGPSCWDVDMLVKLMDAGMNVCRLNFSHGDHAGHGATVKRIREAAAQRPEKNIAILLDTKGPEIRTGFFSEGSKIELQAGNELKLTTDYSFKGDSTCLAVSYKKLPESVKPGSIILCADGSLSLKVKSCGYDHVITEVMNNCTIGERKNVNLPGVQVDLPVLQEKDIDDIMNFGIPQDVDWIAASFVQSKEDLELIRTTLGEKGKHIKIMSKIENEAGLNNFDDIVQASDGIMVARGDLGMEIPPEKVFIAQKIMIAKCNLAGKPVVTATQMLESMTKAPRPTRAEAGDVANAVLDGTDGVMLSGETAGGDFPYEACSIMRRIVEEAEKSIDYSTSYLKMRERTHKRWGSMCLPQHEAMATAAVKQAGDACCPLIIVITESGRTARFIAKYRPEAAILAVCSSERTARQLSVVRGLGVEVISFEGLSFDIIVMKVLVHAKQLGLIKVGEPAVLVREDRSTEKVSKIVTLVQTP